VVRASRPPEDGFAVASAWHSVFPESPIVDLTLSISLRLSSVCAAVSETLKHLPYEQQELSAPVRKRTQRAGDVSCFPYAAASRANRS
jgi:hypothetical protein